MKHFICDITPPKWVVEQLWNLAHLCGFPGRLARRALKSALDRETNEELALMTEQVGKE